MTTTTDDFSDLGFEPCNFEPDSCELCKNIRPLYFGNRDYWDSREGSYLCAACLSERRADTEVEQLRLCVEKHADIK